MKLEDIAVTVVCKNCNTSQATLQELNEELKMLIDKIAKQRKSYKDMLFDYEQQIANLEIKMRETRRNLENLEEKEKELVKRNQDSEKDLKQKAERFQREIQDKQDLINTNMKDINGTMIKLNKSIELKQKQLFESEQELEEVQSQVDGLKYQKNKMQALQN